MLTADALSYYFCSVVIYKGWPGPGASASLGICSEWKLSEPHRRLTVLECGARAQGLCDAPGYVDVHRGLSTKGSD